MDSWSIGQDYVYEISITAGSTVASLALGQCAAWTDTVQVDVLPLYQV